MGDVLEPLAGGGGSNGLGAVAAFAVVLFDRFLEAGDPAAGDAEDREEGVQKCLGSAPSLVSFAHSFEKARARLRISFHERGIGGG